MGAGGTQQGLETRIRFITAVLGLVLLVLVGRLVFIQSVCHAEYSQKAKRITTYVERRHGFRGTVVDCRGRLLAYDRHVYDLHCYIQGLQRTRSRQEGDLVRELEAVLGDQGDEGRRRLNRILIAGEVRVLKRCLLGSRPLTSRQYDALIDYLTPAEGFFDKPDRKRIAKDHRLRIELYRRLGLTDLEGQVLTGDSRCCPSLLKALPSKWLARLGESLRAGKLPGWQDRMRILAHLARPRDRVLVKGITDASSLRLLRKGNFPQRWSAALGLYLDYRFVREHPLGSDGGVGVGMIPSVGSAIGIERHPSLRPGKDGCTLARQHGRPRKTQKLLENVTNRGEIYTGREIPPAPSGTVQLTLDAKLQAETMRVLCREAEKHEPKYAACLVMDIHQGDILAMGSWPPIDPSGELNQDGRTRVASRRNHCVESRFPPGSTMKSLVIAAALEEKLVNLHTPIDCAWNHPQGYRIPRCRRPAIRDDHRVRGVDHPSRTPLDQVLIQSSNIGAYRVGQRFTRQRFVHWFKTFGLNRPSGLGLPREIGPNWKPVQDLVGERPNREGDFARWTGPNASFGYSFSVNLVTLASSYCALGNGGYLVRPRLVSRLLDGEGAPKECPPRLRHRILSTATADAMRATLGRVVTDPNGTAYRMAGETRGRFGGKTGTAFRRNVAGKRVYWALFVGFAPVDRPRYLAAAVFYKEETSRFYGGERAGPTVRDLLLTAVREVER